MTATKAESPVAAWREWLWRACSRHDEIRADLRNKTTLSVKTLAHRLLFAREPGLAAVDVTPGDASIAQRIENAQGAVHNRVRREVDVRAKDGLVCSSIELRVGAGQTGDNLWSCGTRRSRARALRIARKT
jgi:hypothetical protein